MFYPRHICATHFPRVTIRLVRTRQVAPSFSARIRLIGSSGSISFKQQVFIVRDEEDRPKLHGNNKVDCLELHSEDGVDHFAPRFAGLHETHCIEFHTGSSK